jgi:hypothetical protein
MADTPTVERKIWQSFKGQKTKIVVNILNYIKAKNPDQSVS